MDYRAVGFPLLSPKEGSSHPEASERVYQKKPSRRLEVVLPPWAAGTGKMKAGEKFLGEPDTCPLGLETYMDLETDAGFPSGGL